MISVFKKYMKAITWVLNPWVCHKDTPNKSPPLEPFTGYKDVNCYCDNEPKGYDPKTGAIIASDNMLVFVGAMALDGSRIDVTRFDPLVYSSPGVPKVLQQFSLYPTSPW